MSSEISYDRDPDGEKTLQVISKAGKFNEWMYKTIAPYCSGNILEIGSGIGNISAFFIREGYSMTLSDLRSHYFDELNQKFGSYPNLEKTIILDLVDKNFREKFSGYEGYFDTIFALNVVEHIEDDSQAIGNCRFMLKPGGKIIVLVPAYQELYNQFDTNLGHFRRYTKKSLQEVIARNGFEIVHTQYFNLAGILGWFFSGKILRKQTIPEGQMGLYNALVPVFKIADRLILNKAGLSVIAVGKVV